MGEPSLVSPEVGRHKGQALTVQGLATPDVKPWTERPRLGSPSTGPFPFPQEGTSFPFQAGRPRLPWRSGPSRSAHANAHPGEKVLTTAGWGVSSNRCAPFGRSHGDETGSRISDTNQYRGLILGEFVLTEALAQPGHHEGSA
jgi:hypothetical protein